MKRRPSWVLINFLRKAMESSGITMSELAGSMERDERELDQLFDHSVPMTVDEFMEIAQALHVESEDLGVPSDMASLVPAGIASFGIPSEILAEAGPDSNPTREAIRLGFAVGCDLFFVVDTNRLTGSGLPQSVLDNFPDKLPIRLDADYHTYNDPEFGEDGLTVVLSFDQLHTCTFAWDSFLQVTFLPAAADRPAPEPESTERPSHLRLVE